MLIRFIQDEFSTETSKKSLPQIYKDKISSDPADQSTGEKINILNAKAAEAMAVITDK